MRIENLDEQILTPGLSLLAGGGDFRLFVASFSVDEDDTTLLNLMSYLPPSWTIFLYTTSSRAHVMNFPRT